MNFNDLAVLWKKRSERYSIWEDKLLNNAETLREIVEGILRPPADGVVHCGWKANTGEITHRHIDILDLPIGGNLRYAKVSRNSIDGNGELVFGLAITLHSETEAHPNSTYCIPVATRFIEGRPEFAMLDTAAARAEQWEGDAERFAHRLISDLAEYLQFDPFSGPPKRTPISCLHH